MNSIRTEVVRHDRANLARPAGHTTGGAQHAPVVHDEVVAVLLVDGWHRVSSGSFTTGALGFDAAGGEDVLGFRFDEPHESSAYAPATVAGPLDGLLAVRQVPRRRRSRPRAVDGTTRSLGYVGSAPSSGPDPASTPR
jgi:hypothetical protein